MATSPVINGQPAAVRPRNKHTNIRTYPQSSTCIAPHRAAQRAHGHTGTRAHRILPYVFFATGPPGPPGPPFYRSIDRVTITQQSNDGNRATRELRLSLSGANRKCSARYERYRS